MVRVRKVLPLLEHRLGERLRVVAGDGDRAHVVKASAEAGFPKRRKEVLGAVDVGLFDDFRVGFDVVKSSDVEAVPGFGQCGDSGLGQAQIRFGKIAAHQGQRPIRAPGHLEEGIELVPTPFFGAASEHQRHVHAAPEQSFDHGTPNQSGSTGHKRMIRRAHRPSCRSWRLMMMRWTSEVPS